MVKRRISKLVNVEGRAVPVDSDGRYLDWTKIDPKSMYAAVLTSPHGYRHFVLGGDVAKIVLDYAKLPNGHYFLTAECEPETLDLHPEDRTIVSCPKDVVESAYHLVSHAIEALERAGVDCHDPWEFLRKICVDVEKAPCSA